MYLFNEKFIKFVNNCNNKSLFNKFFTLYMLHDHSTQNIYLTFVILIKILLLKRESIIKMYITL